LQASASRPDSSSLFRKSHLYSFSEKKEDGENLVAVAEFAVHCTPFIFAEAVGVGSKGAGFSGLFQAMNETEIIVWETNSRFVYFIDYSLKI